ncbi:uncharacterized protein LOC118376832 [Oncorhynchus keta]|uniref:uncharacterized protein LOC118376832 n=1 Tax=Oncorhynchus keta TaxID=8018 RepID=UPI00227B5F67|nr:uncharacterized protein LOC118376832 [Oncorhynchus keta]
MSGWYKLNSKTGKKEKERGDIQVTVQFTKNNLTASMYDLSLGKDKPRSTFGKIKDRIKGKKRSSKDSDEDSASTIGGGYGPVSRMRNRLPSDGGGEEDYEDDEGGEGRRSKMRNFFLRGKLRKSSDTRSSTSLGSESSESSSRGGSLSPTAGISVVVSDLSNSPSNSSNFTADSPDHTAELSPKLASYTCEFTDESGEINIPVPQPVCINGSHVYNTTLDPCPGNPVVPLDPLALVKKNLPLSQSLQNLNQRREELPVLLPKGPAADGRRWSFDKAGKEEKVAIAAALEQAGQGMGEGAREESDRDSRSRNCLDESEQASNSDSGPGEKHKGWFGSKDNHNKPSPVVSPSSGSHLIPHTPGLTPLTPGLLSWGPPHLPVDPNSLGTPLHHTNPFSPSPPLMSPSNPFLSLLQCNPFYEELLADQALNLNSAQPHLPPCCSSFTSYISVAPQTWSTNPNPVPILPPTQDSPVTPDCTNTGMKRASLKLPPEEESANTKDEEEEEEEAVTPDCTNTGMKEQRASLKLPPEEKSANTKDKEEEEEAVTPDCTNTGMKEQRASLKLPPEEESANTKDEEEEEEAVTPDCTNTGMKEQRASLKLPPEEKSANTKDKEEEEEAVTPDCTNTGMKEQRASLKLPPEEESANTKDEEEEEEEAVTPDCTNTGMKEQRASLKLPPEVSSANSPSVRKTCPLLTLPSVRKTCPLLTLLCEEDMSSANSPLCEEDMPSANSPLCEEDMSYAKAETPSFYTATGPDNMAALDLMGEFSDDRCSATCDDVIRSDTIDRATSHLGATCVVKEKTTSPAARIDWPIGMDLESYNSAELSNVLLYSVRSQAHSPLKTVQSTTGTSSGEKVNEDIEDYRSEDQYSEHPRVESVVVQHSLSEEHPRVESVVVQHSLSEEHPRVESVVVQHSLSEEHPRVESVVVQHSLSEEHPRVESVVVQHSLSEEHPRVESVVVQHSLSEEHPRVESVVVQHSLSEEHPRVESVVVQHSLSEEHPRVESVVVQHSLSEEHPRVESVVVQHSLSEEHPLQRSLSEGTRRNSVEDLTLSFGSDPGVVTPGSSSFVQQHDTSDLLAASSFSAPSSLTAERNTSSPPALSSLPAPPPATVRSSVSTVSAATLFSTAQPVIGASHAGMPQETHPPANQQISDASYCMSLYSPHPVKPLTPEEKRRAELSEGRSVLDKLKSSIHPGRSSQPTEQQPEKKKSLTEGAGPYYHLTHSELVALLLQREADLHRQRVEFDHQRALLAKREAELKKMKPQVRDLEDYIDTLLVRIMEQTPTILQVGTKLK